MNNSNEFISCVCASDYLKKNTDSIKNAVENDLFSISPKLDLIYELDNLVCKED